MPFVYELFAVIFDCFLIGYFQSLYLINIDVFHTRGIIKQKRPI